MHVWRLAEIDCVFVGEGSADSNQEAKSCFYCHYCGVALNSPQQLEEHKEGTDLSISLHVGADLIECRNKQGRPPAQYQKKM